MDLTKVHQGVSKLRRKKRVGRGIGSGHGKTSTRGHKGQYAAGADKPIGFFEGGQMQLFRRIPKRGFSHGMWDKHFLVVNVGCLSSHFNDGDVVDHESLRKKGLANGPTDGIRILGTGDLSKKLQSKLTIFPSPRLKRFRQKVVPQRLFPHPQSQNETR